MEYRKNEVIITEDLTPGEIISSLLPQLHELQNATNLTAKYFINILDLYHEKHYMLVDNETRDHYGLDSNLILFNSGGGVGVGKDCWIAQPEPPADTTLLWVDTDDNEGEGGGPVNVDLSNYYNKQQIDNMFNSFTGGNGLPAQYRINNQSEDYTTQEADFNGATIIRCLKETDQTITITKPTDDFLGNTLTIRKVGWDETSVVTILPGDGVTLKPEDANVLRRSGSTITLIYVEDGVFDVYGELA